MKAYYSNCPVDPTATLCCICKDDSLLDVILKCAKGHFTHVTCQRRYCFQFIEEQLGILPTVVAPRESNYNPRCLGCSKASFSEVQVAKIVGEKPELKNAHIKFLALAPKLVYLYGRTDQAKTDLLDERDQLLVEVTECRDLIENERDAFRG